MIRLRDVKAHRERATGARQPGGRRRIPMSSRPSASIWAINQLARQSQPVLPQPQVIPAGQHEPQLRRCPHLQRLSAGYATVRATSVVSWRLVSVNWLNRPQQPFYGGLDGRGRQHDRFQDRRKFRLRQRETPSSGSDHFYGSAGAGYTVSVAPGASLFSRFAIRPGQSPGLGTIGSPDGELIVIDHGTLTNDGTLNVYPASTDPPGSDGCDYCQTAGVVYITGGSGQPSSVVNRGTIGDRVPGSSFGGATAEHGYGQIDSYGVLMADGTVVNDAGGLITGYNAIFTTGSAASNRIDNYGDIDATNDGALSSYLIVNHQGGAINTGPAGFACVHAYGDVINYGYMLGSDYGMLLEGAGTQISDYGGPPVPGVRNFDGSAVYNGEISSIPRSTGVVNTGGPYLSADAVMMDTSHSTITLDTTTSGGTVWLPVINGPMVGGFNGDFDSAAAHQVNTLAFD